MNVMNDLYSPYSFGGDDSSLAEKLVCGAATAGGAYAARTVGTIIGGPVAGIAAGIVAGAVIDRYCEDSITIRRSKEGDYMTSSNGGSGRRTDRRKEV